MKHCSFSLFLLAICFLASPPAFADTINVWTYHEFPPFIVNEQEQTGLSYDLAELLTERSRGEHEFRLQVVPRERVNNRLKTGEPGIALWVNPNWFNDNDQTKYLWTSPLLPDSNSVISQIARPIEYDGNKSLVGKKLVAVRGHTYDGVQELVTAGKIDRIDVDTEIQAVRMIASARADAAIIASSAANFFTKTLNFTDSIYFSQKTQSEYNRFILVQPQLRSIHGFLNTFTAGLRSDNEWKTLLGKYGL